MKVAINQKLVFDIPVPVRFDPSNNAIESKLMKKYMKSSWNLQQLYRIQNNKTIV